MVRTCPKCDREFGSYKGYSNHYKSKHDGHPLVSLVGESRLREMYDDTSENQVADTLDVSRNAVANALRHIGVPRRGQSEAEMLKNEQMSEEERRRQTRKAREEHFEKYGDGGHIGHWTAANPEEHRAAARQAAALGTPARQENGMAGVTGQDHPNWRGGKSIYDAVKKQLPGPSWNTLKDRHREDECAMCGATADESDRALDVHHIVPLLCGGTNEEWNFITLCMSCHHRAEWYTRDLLDPVLTG